MKNNKHEITQPRSAFRSCGLALAIAALSPCAAISVSAESLALEEVIVTAQKRAQSLQDVPISVAAVSGEKISKASIQNLGELSMHMPNVQINEAGIDNNIFIRGVGSGVNLGFEKSVGMYVDGVYAGRGQLSRAPFMDMERVEVLKGPQGILFGKNTIGGAINISTARPTQEFESYVQATINPEHGDREMTGVVSGPLSDSVAGRLAVNYRKLDGYFTHQVTGEDMRQRENQIVRGTLDWNPTEDLEMIFKAQNSTFDDEGRQMQVMRSSQAFSYLEYDDKVDNGSLPGRKEYNNTDTQLASITANISLGEHTLTSISAYQTYDTAMSDDVMQTPFFNNPGDVNKFQMTTGESFTQLSQEIRLLSPIGETFDYIVGGYFQTADLEVSRNTLWPWPALDAPTARNTQQDSDSAAVFAQGSWHLNDRLQLTLGGRYGEENKDWKRVQTVSDDFDGLHSVKGPQGPVNLSRSESKFTGSFNVQYDASDDVMLYLTASTGFKGGGFDEALNRSLVAGETAQEAFEFDSETVKSAEIGAKMTLADGAATLNVALFRGEYDDLQTSAFDGVAGFSVQNAGSSLSQGLEVDGRWRLTEALTLSAAMSYLDASYEEFKDGPCSQYHAAQGVCTSSNKVRDLSGMPLVFSPEWSSNVSADYVIPIGSALALTSTLDLMYTGDFYTAQDLDPNTMQAAYTKVNLRIALSDQDEKWSVALVGKNLTNKRTSGWINDVTFNSFPNRSDTYYALTEPPRTLALQGRYSF